LSARRVGVAYFFLFFGVGVSVPYFPLWLTSIGCSGLQVGLAGGVQPIIRWASATGFAYAADRWRIRYRLTVWTGIAGALCYLPLLFTRRFDVLMAMFALIAVFHGPLIPMVEAAVVDHLADLGADYGRLRLWGSIGFIVGAWGSAPIVQVASPSIVPLLLLMAVVPLAVALFGLPRGQRTHVARFRAPWELWSLPLGVFLLAGFLLQVSCGAWTVLFPRHTHGLGMSDVIPGMTFGLAVVVEVAILYWGRALLDASNPARLLLIVLIVNVVRWGLTAVTTAPWLVVGLQLGHVFSFIIFHLAALALLARLIPPQSTTSGQALYGMVAFGLGGSIGQLLAGGLVDRLGTAGVFAVEAMITGAAVPLGIWLLWLVDQPVATAVDSTRPAA
jgi:MFS transporter, PPP family, 3-phenylpropionic acid transporter